MTSDPHTPFTSRGGVLHADDASLPELAERFGTPLYVYSHRALTGRLAGLREAFGDLDPLVAYSVKANPNLAVIRSLAQLGAGADVVSGGELARALRAGVPAERIVFSGVGKRPDELRAAAEAGILCFNVEVSDELELLSLLGQELGRELGVALRVNPDVDAGSHDYITVGRKVDKFGLPLEDAPALYRRAAELPGLRPLGVDCHIGSQLTNTEPFVEALSRMAQLVRDLRADGLPVELLDVGGGLGVRYTDEQPPTLAAYADAVRSQVQDLGCRLILEPGRSIVANAGLLLTRVLYVKVVRGKRFLIVDAAMNDMPRPSLYGARHGLQAVVEGPGLVDADVVGPICETGDFILRGGQAPDLAEGDLLAVHSAGAYCRSMASNYNTRPRAAEVLVRGAEAHLVGERETVDALMAGERIPDFLGA
jgi:diaminopimelate decarboxylase